VGVSFQRAATQTLLSSSNAPKAVIRGLVQAEEGYLRASGNLLGLCSSGNLLGLCSKELWSQAAVRWNEAGLCGPLKRDPHDPPIH
jgi:hypothetical protein